MGSFDDGYMTHRQSNSAYIRLLAFAKDNYSWISGIDLHIHHVNNVDITASLDFILPQKHSTQEFIVTEYSLHKWWQANIHNPLSTQFKNAHPHAGLTDIESYINYAVQNKVTLAEWDDFNSMHSFLNSRQDYITASFNLFNARPSFWIAFYAIAQRYPTSYDHEVDGAWILNGLFVSGTVQPDANGHPQKRFGFFDDFVLVNN